MMLYGDRDDDTLTFVLDTDEGKKWIYENMTFKINGRQWNVMSPTLLHTNV